MSISLNDNKTFNDQLNWSRASRLALVPLVFAALNTYALFPTSSNYSLYPARLSPPAMAELGDGPKDNYSNDEAPKCLCGQNSCEECSRIRSSRSGLPSSSSSCSLLSLDSYPVQDYDKTWRVYTASVKGFVIGAGLKGGLAIFALLTRLRRRRLLPSSK